MAHGVINHKDCDYYHGDVCHCRWYSGCCSAAVGDAIFLAQCVQCLRKPAQPAAVPRSHGQPASRHIERYAASAAGSRTAAVASPAATYCQYRKRKWYDDVIGRWRRRAAAAGVLVPARWAGVTGC